MILTKEILEEGKSSKGSWSHEQIRCFGVEMQNNPGWKRQIIGKEYDQESIDKFLSLKDKHLKKSSSKSSGKKNKCSDKMNIQIFFLICPGSMVKT